MKKVLLIIGFMFFYSSSAWAGPCNTTLSSDSTSQLDCSDNDELTVNEGVSLSRSGSVALNGQSDIY